ncbi:putative signal peptide and transmembrane protein [Rhodopirellula islandica]|uniref:Signal peptide and transmembrane protein n=1 Tax=Rhodopirellula islandica TaxID=595434 RepID=A0A0J1BI24_RHOIS|nr:putative signal peptide and transmembrane protein [Rhodopirellula islandica]
MPKHTISMLTGLLVFATVLCSPTTYADEPTTETDPRPSEGVIRFEFSGSYNVVIDGATVATGQGTTTVELSQTFAYRLFHDFQKTLQDSNIVGDDVAKGISSLPSTIRSANETLKLLSDPETQESLRQVESMLRLLPRTTVPKEMSTDSDSDQN